jgi:MFS family permease
MAAIPLSSVLGAPVSGLLLGLDGMMGLKGWQWMFVVEALPALILSGVVLTFLTDRPALAKWLPADQRAWLANRLVLEEKQRTAAQHFTVFQALTNPRVLALSVVYFGAVACNYGVGFFMPQIVKDFGLSNVQTGFVTAIPYVVGVVGIVYWGWRSDQKQERKMHEIIALAIAAGGILASTFLPDPFLKMVALSVAAFGVFGCLPVFWAMPTSFLSGAAAAGGIAIINAIGNLSGFAGPYLMGYLKDQTGNFNLGLQCLSGLGFLAMVIVMMLRHDTALERAPGAHVSPAE